MSEDWRGAMRSVRHQLPMTQREVASQAGLSTDTVRSYETGRKHPRREHLVAILDVLKIARDARNAILTSAGFSPDGHLLTYDYPRGMFLPAEAVAHVAKLPWPAFVLDEHMKVLGANDAARQQRRQTGELTKAPLAERVDHLEGMKETSSSAD